MALSNKFGWLVLTTGNKSEMSVGYSTLYGDSAGGFAVIKDVPKLLVYRLTRRRDERAGGGLVPAESFTRPPSAELRPDQRDDDSLPPYEILDAILEGYVEHDLGREQLVARGLPAEDVDRVIRLVDLAEYKRRQQPPGHQDHDARVRPRPPRADHQPLPRLRRQLTGRRVREGRIAGSAAVRRQSFVSPLRLHVRARSKTLGDVTLGRSGRVSRCGRSRVRHHAARSHPRREDRLR